jgi:hypothetical protein
MITTRTEQYAIQKLTKEENPNEFERAKGYVYSLYMFDENNNPVRVQSVFNSIESAQERARNLIQRGQGKW